MSNEPTIDRMNEAIAEFMGYSHGNRNREFNPDADYKEEEFKYHSSWDALMPVGKKIYDLLAEMAKQRPPHTACHGDMIEVDIHCHIREYNLPKAHEAIFQFLQWYQKQQANEQ